MVTTPTSPHVEENTNSNLHTISGKMIDGARAGKSVAMERKHEWGVILAGGEGTRLKSLTRRIIDDERPKQFCPVMGDVTLVEETQRRVAEAARGSEGKRHQMERSRRTEPRSRIDPTGRLTAALEGKLRKAFGSQSGLDRRFAAA